jgi:hypothetical protein
LKELKSVSGFINLETADIYLISGGLDVNMIWLEKLSTEDEEIINSCVDHDREYSDRILKESRSYAQVLKLI